MTPRAPVERYDGKSEVVMTMTDPANFHLNSLFNSGHKITPRVGVRHSALPPFPDITTTQPRESAWDRLAFASTTLRETINC
jgi:hypothetical protein